MRGSSIIYLGFHPCRNIQLIAKTKYQYIDQVMLVNFFQYSFLFRNRSAWTSYSLLYISSILTARAIYVIVSFIFVFSFWQAWVINRWKWYIVADKILLYKLYSCGRWWWLSGSRDLTQFLSLWTVFLRQTNLGGRFTYSLVEGFHRSGGVLVKGDKHRQWKYLSVLGGDACLPGVRQCVHAFSRARVCLRGEGNRCS